MDNLFLNAMDTQDVVDINNIKLNKEFCLRLISDLSKVFQTNHKVEDDKDFVKIKMKTSPDHNWHHCFYFIANKDAILFSCNVLTYKNKIGHLYDKYKANLGTEKNGDDFANYNINIFIDRYDVMLSDKLKDIVELMNLNGFKKIF